MQLEKGVPYKDLIPGLPNIYSETAGKSQSASPLLGFKQRTLSPSPRRAHTSEPLGGGRGTREKDTASQDPPLRPCSTGLGAALGPHIKARLVLT